MIVLDTNILIAIEKGDAQTRAWFAELPETPHVVGFAAMELLAGCENAADRRRIERQLSAFHLLWPDEEALDRAAANYGSLRLSHGVSVLDMLIATTAMHFDCELATYNVRHFRGVPGLKLCEPKYPVAS